MCFLGGLLWWLTEQRNPKIIAKHTEWYNKFGCKQWSRYPYKVPQQLVLKSHRFAQSFPVSRGLFTLVFGGRGEKRPTNYSKRRCSVVGVIRKADVNQSKKSHIKMHFLTVWSMESAAVYWLWTGLLAAHGGGGIGPPRIDWCIIQ